MATSQPLQIFVTVGSTSFPALLARLLSPTFLSILPWGCQLSIQYGRSELATVLASMDEDSGLMSTSMTGNSSDPSASKSAVIYDEGSRLVPEVGLRASKSQGLSYKGSQLKDLDPGRTGSLQGWQMIGSSASSAAASNSRVEGGSKDKADRGSLEGEQWQGSSSSNSNRAIDLASDQDSSEADSSSSDTESQSDEDEDDSPSAASNVAFSTLPPSLTFKTSSGIQLTLMDFVPDLSPHLAKADIVIAHAGAGTLLETLRFRRPKRSDATEDGEESKGSSRSGPPLLIIVPNTTLMGNHQDELADAMVQGRWAWKAALESESTKSTALETVLKEVVDVWKYNQEAAEISSAEKGNVTLPRPFPAARPNRFRSLVDEEMGFL